MKSTETTYKMIAIDIDDTLLNDDLQVTELTRLAITEALQQGVIVTLATGRMYASAQKIAEQLDLNVPLITYQGAWVKNLLDGKMLYERNVPHHITEYMFKYVRNNDLYLQLYWNDTLYVKKDGARIQEYARQSDVPYVVEPNVDRMINLPQTKLLMIDEPDRLDQVRLDLERLLGAAVHITKSKPHYLEVLHPEATKGHALRYLAGQYGCDMGEVIAIGDSWNDHEMVEAAGLGVAMDNAVPALKEIADYVTLSNNDEGVKHVIEKFVLRRSL